MTPNKKMIHVVLCGLVLLFIIMPATASAETDPVLDCIARYQKMGYSYDEAKKICTANAVQATVEPTQTAVQYLPDLVVDKILCAPGNKLEFNVENRLTPIPSGWRAVADVYINGVKQGSIDLGRPTGGDLTVGGANYLTAFDITGSAEVKIVVDPTNSIKEADERNNAMVLKVSCQAPADTAAATVDPIAECIAKNQKLRGMSYEEAKKYCTTPADTVSSIDSCAKKYMEVFGITYDEAKKRCLEESQTAGTSGGGCAEKYMDVFGITYEEAAKLCAAGQTPADVNAVINRCGDLEKRLQVLVEKLNAAEGQDADNLIKEIQALKTELRTCQAKTPLGTKESTPGIKNPCDEVGILKESIAQLEKKMMYLREIGANTTGYGYLDQSGTSGYGYLDEYNKEYHYLSARLEKMSFACQQGKPYDESPCARLAGLEMIYKEINAKIASSTDDKNTAELKTKLASVVKEIEALKQRCRAEELNSGNVGSLIDLENAYRAKQKAIVEGASDRDMKRELTEVEDEKNKLLKDMALNLSELDARQITIIKQLELKDGMLLLDDTKLKARKVKLSIKDRDIEIESDDSGISITDGTIEVKGDVPLDYTDGALKSGKSGKEIRMMPGHLIKGIEGMDYVTIDDEPTWLPITLVFQASQLSPQPDPPGVTLPIGTKGEKLGEGHYRFLLPDGRVVELKNFDKKGRTGDVSIFGADGAAVVSGMKGKLTGAPKPEKSRVEISPSTLKELILKDDGTKPEYVAKVEKKGKILGVIPATIPIEYRISAETGDVAGTDAPWWKAIAIIDPDPPS